MEKLIIYSELATYFGYRRLDLIKFQVKISKFFFLQMSGLFLNLPDFELYSDFTEILNIANYT